MHGIPALLWRVCSGSTYPYKSPNFIFPIMQVISRERHESMIQYEIFVEVIVRLVSATRIGESTSRTPVSNLELRFHASATFGMFVLTDL